MRNAEARTITRWYEAAKATAERVRRWGWATATEARAQAELVRSARNSYEARELALRAIATATRA